MSADISEISADILNTEWHVCEHGVHVYFVEGVHAYVKFVSFETWTPISCGQWDIGLKWSPKNHLQNTNIIINNGRRNSMSIKNKILFHFESKNRFLFQPKHFLKKQFLLKQDLFH